MRRRPSRGALWSVLLVQVTGVRGSEIDQKSAQALHDGRGVPLALFPTRLRRVADTRVARDLRPPAWCPGPPLAQRRDAEAPRLPLARFGEWAHERRRDVQHDARLELPGVITEIVEIVRRVHHLVPVRHTQEDLQARLQLPDRRAEIVAPVPVENHELADALALEAAREIAQHGGLRAGVEVETEPDIELTRLHAEWHDREDHHARARLP